jgi:hypothetical protein
MTQPPGQARAQLQRAVRAVGHGLFVAAVALLALIAFGAALELATSLNGVWERFPAPLGVTGLAIVGGVVGVSALGFVGVRRVPLTWAMTLAIATLVVTRVGALFLVEPSLLRDQAAYDQLARGVLAGECCFGVRAMGYPILLAVPYALGLSGKLVGFTFALAAAPLLYLLGRELAGRRAGAMAIYLYAAAPSLVLFSGVLMTETTYATVLLAALVPVVMARSAMSGAAGGLLLGLTQYVRATSVFLAPAILLPMFMRGNSRRAGLWLAGLLVALLPVFVATGGISTSTVGGLSVMMGTNQEYNGRYNNDDVALYGSWGDDRERLAMQEAIRRIAADPAGFAALVVRKSHIMWTEEYYGVVFAMTDAGVPERYRAPARVVSQAAYVLLLAGATIAAWRARRSPSDVVLVILGIFVSVAVIHGLAEVQHRFHAYVVPLFAVLAAAALVPRSETDSTTETTDR